MAFSMFAISSVRPTGSYLSRQPKCRAYSYPSLRRFVWLKRLLLLCLVLVLLVFLSRAWLVHHEEHRLAAEIANWKAAGLPILLDDFQTPPVPDDENAALAINRAAQLVVQSP